MAYCALSLLVSHRQRWSVITWLLTLAGGLIPFAFALMERFPEKERRKSSASVQRPR